MRGYLIGFAALVGATILFKVFSAETSIDLAATPLADIAKMLIVPIVLAIAAPAFVYVTSFLILAAAVAACVWYWFIVTQARRKMVQATIADLTELTVIPDLPAEGRWERLAAIVPKNGFFGTSWGLFVADRHSDRNGARLPFSWYVAKDPAITGIGRTGLMASLPSYFTSVGLILTFVGLVIALYFAARGFRSGSMDEARQAIVQLLAASSFKFLTSVAALFSALLISICARLADRRLTRDIAKASHLVDQLCATLPFDERATGADSALLQRLDRLIAALEVSQAGNERRLPAQAKPAA